MKTTANKGYNEDQIFAKFCKDARFLGGGCYSISWFGHDIFNTCTGKLFQLWKACFVKRQGRYYYS
jgi:hypothetical protein